MLLSIFFHILFHLIVSICISSCFTYANEELFLKDYFGTSELQRERKREREGERRRVKENHAITISLPRWPEVPAVRMKAGVRSPSVSPTCVAWSHVAFPTSLVCSWI